MILSLQEQADRRAAMLKEELERRRKQIEESVENDRIQRMVCIFSLFTFYILVGNLFLL